jgi:O6-methylguanine-DNA--protein-cysteine methyltransferase
LKSFYFRENRVLAANKKLGGFSGGLDWKRSLLAREGVQF